MILNLDLYQAPEPYPKLKHTKKDFKYASLLMEGYSGAVSELTTVLQYANHSLRCRAVSPDISQTMRGIFYVETIHMELLGECVTRLGGNGKYTLSVMEKNVPWQSSLVSYGATPGKMLQADIEGEKQAVAFYTQAAEMIPYSDIKALLLRLAEDEKLHVKLLSDLYYKYFR